MLNDILVAVKFLSMGKVISYPTEGMYGLGCDARNSNAVVELCRLKNRDISKGLIIVTSQWEDVSSWVKPISHNSMLKINKTWPGPYTWVFSTSSDAPPWIAQEKSIAIRISSHPEVKFLTQEFKGPIVSTSANKEGEPPCLSKYEVEKIFPKGISYILPGKIGKLGKPSTIIEAETNKVLRA